MYSHISNVRAESYSMLQFICQLTKRNSYVNLYVITLLTTIKLQIMDTKPPPFGGGWMSINAAFGHGFISQLFFLQYPHVDGQVYEVQRLMVVEGPPLPLASGYYCKVQSVTCLRTLKYSFMLSLHLGGNLRGIETCAKGLNRQEISGSGHPQARHRVCHFHLVQGHSVALHRPVHLHEGAVEKKRGMKNKVIPCPKGEALCPSLAML